MIEPSFGGVNLEDIAQPKCFAVLDQARRRLSIPVWHDDQQGTATVTMAGLLNALRVVGKELGDARIAFVGSGLQACPLGRGAALGVGLVDQ